MAPQRERGAVLLPRVGTHTHAHTLPPAPPLREPDAEVHFKTGVDTQIEAELSSLFQDSHLPGRFPNLPERARFGS